MNLKYAFRKTCWSRDLKGNLVFGFNGFFVLSRPTSRTISKWQWRNWSSEWSWRRLTRLTHTWFTSSKTSGRRTRKDWWGSMDDCSH